MRNGGPPTAMLDASPAQGAFLPLARHPGFPTLASPARRYMQIPARCTRRLVPAQQAGTASPLTLSRFCAQDMPGGAVGGGGGTRARRAAAGGASDGTPPRPTAPTAAAFQAAAPPPPPVRVTPDGLACAQRRGIVVSRAADAARPAPPCFKRRDDAQRTARGGKGEGAAALFTGRGCPSLPPPPPRPPQKKKKKTRRRK